MGENKASSTLISYIKSKIMNNCHAYLHVLPVTHTTFGDAQYFSGYIGKNRSHCGENKVI